MTPNNGIKSQCSRCVEKQESLGALVLATATAALAGAAWSFGENARQVFLFQEKTPDPVIAGSARDKIPALMRGNRPAATTSYVRNEPMRQKPPRMCEMPDDYFDSLERAPANRQGYDRRNAYVRKYQDRRGFLNEREMNAARVAWKYFENFTQESTGLANAVENFPSTTLWDTASYIAGLVSAYQLCLIEKPEFDRRIMKPLTTIKTLDLFRNEMPNKVYHTKTAAKVDYTNKPGEIGFSALDIGRFLVWMRILKNRYPYLSNTIDATLLKWDYSNTIEL